MTKLDDDPLWQFALTVYPQAQATLLEWQDQRGVHVNDVLWLAFARFRGVAVDWRGWRSIEQGRPRNLLRRVRALRKQLSRSAPARERALTWELALEAIDIRLLHRCIDDRPNRDPSRDIKRLAHHWNVDEPALAALLKRLAGVAESGKR